MKSHEKNILELFASNSLKIGQVVAEKDNIVKISPYWMDIDAPKKVKLFTDIVETDPGFKKLSGLIKTVSKEILLGTDKSLAENLSKITVKLDIFSRYIAMAYVGLKVGLRVNEGEKKVIGCYRIGDWNLKGYHLVINAFNLREMVESWDEETSLCKPVHLKNGKLVKTMTCDNYYWDFGADAWNEAIEYYLINERKVEIVSQTETKNTLDSLYQKDLLLQELHPDVQAVLPKVLGLDNIFLIKIERLKNIVKALKNFSPEKSFMADGVIGVIQNFGGPHPSKGWDVRISSSVIHVFANGKMYRYEFDPYYEYWDTPGGSTYHRDELEAKAIKSISVSKRISVEVEMVYGQKSIFVSKVDSFVRSRLKGEKEEFYDESFRIWRRLTYEFKPEDLNFSFQDQEETY